ncbi:MAG TPA: biopolymer transporter ExbD [Kofleriaceae bacterium]|nr:biopolymer transporter ExbD [Kofleriaceae bacterium]
MPVHSPGSRLYSSIPFKHLAAAARGGRSRKVDVFLNMTPMVDMMTVLVTFLLMVFSASGELISAQRALVLPNAVRALQLKRAPVIVVSRDTITFNGERMGDVQQIARDEGMEWKIVELYDRLRQEKTQFRMSGFDKLPPEEQKYCTDPVPDNHPDWKPDMICLDGLLILQADRDTSAKVINRIIKTAYAAEYPNVMFAVNRRAGQ